MPNESDNIDRLATFAVTNATQYPAQYTQYRSEVPSSIKATVVPSRTQLTRRSFPETINRSVVIGSFWLNPPFKEPVIRIASIYRALYDMAFNYDRTHYDSFFEAYPNLLLHSEHEWERTQKEGEETVTIQVMPTTAELKRDIKKYCKRVAHYLYYYEIGFTNYTAALLNMLALTRYEGQAPFKELAEHFKWGRINTRTGIYNTWFAPCGLIDYMTSKTAYASGWTTYGANLKMIPMWTTDIFASRGAQAPSWMNQFTVDETNADFNLYGGTAAPSTARTLMQNEFRIYQEYGSAEYGNLPPNSPYIENGETIFVKADSKKSGAYFTNRHGFGPGFRAQGVPYANQLWDNVEDSLWNAFSFWERWLLDNFSVFKDPNSGFVTFFTTQLKLLERSKTPKEMLNSVCSAKDYDVATLLSKMAYKGGNHPHTAHFIRLSLPIDIGLDSTDEDYFSDDSFRVNFERYSVDNSDVSTALDDAKKWPSLTPNAIPFPDSSTDGDKSAYPIISDASPSFGFTVDSDHSRAAPLTGSVATWFDLACEASLTPEDTNVTAIGVSASLAEEYVHASDGVIFEEDPSKVFILTQPLFDNTDVYQCGFNVMVSKQDTQSEWDDYFRKPNHYEDLSNELVTSDVVGIFKGSVKIPKYPALVENNVITANLIAGDSSYLDAIGHTLIFVGQGILNHPMLMNACRQSGNMVQYTGIDLCQAKLRNNQLLKLFLATAKGGTTADDITLLHYIAAMHQLASMTSPNDIRSTPVAELTGNAYGLVVPDQLSDMGGGADGQYIVDFMFNPAYGSIPIAMNLNPISDLSDYAPPLPITAVDSTHTAVDTIVPDSYARINSHLPGCNPIHFEGMADFLGGFGLMKSMSMNLKSHISGFIESFVFKPVKAVAGVVRPSEKEEAGRIVLAGADKWAFSLMAKVTISYPGIEDLHPFWDLVCNAEFKLSSDVSPDNQPQSETDAVAKPRMPNSTTRGSTPFEKEANTDKRPAQRPTSARSDSKPVNGNGSKKRRHNKPHKMRPFDGGATLINPKGISGLTDQTVVRSEYADPKTRKQQNERMGSSGSAGDVAMLMQS